MWKSLASCHTLHCQNWHNLICPSPTVLFLLFALLPSHIWSPFQINGKSTWHLGFPTISNNPSDKSFLSLMGLMGWVHNKTYCLLYFPFSTPSFCRRTIYFFFVPLPHDLPQLWGIQWVTDGEDWVNHRALQLPLLAALKMINSA